MVLGYQLSKVNLGTHSKVLLNTNVASMTDLSAVLTLYTIHSRYSL